MKLGAIAACVMLLCCSHPDADADDGAPIMRFDTTVVRLVTGRDTLVIHAEVARTAEQRTMGLMERRSLPDTAGMLFVWFTDQPANAGFWMYRTHIPLDIAFADASGRVVALRQMVPCEAQLIAGCPSYEPGHPYRFALEVNAGVLSRRKVGIGSRLLISDLFKGP